MDILDSVLKQLDSVLKQFEMDSVLLRWHRAQSHPLPDSINLPSGTELLDSILKQFERELSHPLPDSSSFPPEVEALLDPSTDEYMTDNLNQEKEEERCSVPL